jgi:hypothetical protein
MLMCNTQGSCHLQRYSTGLGRGERAFLEKTLFDSSPAHVLHDDVVGTVFSLSPVVDLNDARMGE